jgi:steroid delta-isomerase-like uncharacterized protein
MKQFASLLLLVLVVIVSTAGAQSSKLIVDHFKAMAEHDVHAIAAGYDDSAKIYSPNWPGAKTGPAGATDAFSRYFASTPDLTYHVRHAFSAGENVVVEYTFEGTLSNPEGETPEYMAGKKYTLNGCVVFTIKNDKIIKESNYFDQAAFLRQVGFFDQR